MGAFRRILNAAERKLDGPQEPSPPVWPADQAWARLLVSERDPGSRSGAYSDEAASMLDDVIDRARKLRYGFELEVHRPAHAVYVLRREVRVPAKVEGTLFLKSHKIPAGAEVPLRETGPGEEDVELDWDAYLADPLQADRAYHLRIAEQQAIQRR